jgi:hypothetical protein
MLPAIWALHGLLRQDEIGLRSTLRRSKNGLPAAGQETQAEGRERYYVSSGPLSPIHVLIYDEWHNTAVPKLRSIRYEGYLNRPSLQKFDRCTHTVDGDDGLKVKAA